MVILKVISQKMLGKNAISLQMPLMLIFISAIFLCFAVGYMSSFLLTGLILLAGYMSKRLADQFKALLIQSVRS